MSKKLTQKDIKKDNLSESEYSDISENNSDIEKKKKYMEKYGEKFGKEYKKALYEKKKKDKDIKLIQNGEKIVESLNKVMEEIARYREFAKENDNYNIIDEIETSIKNYIEKTKIVDTINATKLDEKDGVKMVSEFCEKIYKKEKDIELSVIDFCKKMNKSRSKMKCDTEIYAFLCSSNKIYFGCMDKCDNILENYNRTYTTVLNLPEKILGNFKGTSDDLVLVVKYLREKYGSIIICDKNIKIVCDLTVVELEKKFNLKK
jgi:hypothetical protein